MKLIIILPSDMISLEHHLVCKLPGQHIGFIFFLIETILCMFSGSINCPITKLLVLISWVLHRAETLASYNVSRKIKCLKY